MTTDPQEAEKDEVWDAARVETPTDGARARALAAALSALPVPHETAADPPSPSAPAFSTRVRRLRAAGVVAALAVAAALLVTVRAGRDAKDRTGDITAEARLEIAIGTRARAVLEKDAHVVWATEGDVSQTEGSVFYRVEPGTAFRVHTPVGDVVVRGTCLRVKVRGSGATVMKTRDIKTTAAGALVTAAMFVAVYEGKVGVSRAGQTVELEAGEAAVVRAGELRKENDASLAERAFDDRTYDDVLALDAVEGANRNLVASVSEYRARLERMAVERRALEQQLARANERLGQGGDGGDASHAKTEISEDEWKELAKNGTVKMRIPCNWKGGWTPPPAKLDELGLAPADGAVIRDASNRLYESTWQQIRPVCEKVAGPEIAEKLGVDGCPSFVFNYLKGVDKESAMEGMRRVSEMRAGVRPTPPLNDPQLSAVEKILLVLTGEQKAFEMDLAQSLGPEEAHRIVTSESLCSWSSTWNGAGPRKRAP